MLKQAASRLPSIAKTMAEKQISFELSATQQAIRDMSLHFARQEMLPTAAKYDQTGDFPWEIIKKAHSVGLMNTLIPTKYGGPGMSSMGMVLVIETLAYGCSGQQVALSGPTLASAPILNYGTEEQKMKYLGWLASEPVIASLCVTEPGAGSDVAGIKTTAVKKGDEYIINGTKAWITGGGYAKWFYVLARTNPDPKVSTGKAFTGFVIDGDTPGIIRGKKEINMGQRCVDTRMITFEDVRVPAANRIGAEGEGFKVTMNAFDKLRPAVAASAVGVSWRALDEAAKYALQRKTFGTQIANHQAIQCILADMTVNLELSRLITYKAAMDATNNVKAPYTASLAKLFASDTANLAVSNGLQIFGGNGFNSEYPMEKLMRDAKILQIYEGTSQIQRLVIAKHLLANVASGAGVIV